MKRARLLAVAVAFLAGCGGDEDALSTETTTTTTPAETTTVRVYWLRDGKIWPFAREVESGPVAAQAFDALTEGPTSRETSDLGVSSALPGGISFAAAISNTAEVTSSADLSEEARAQVVYTLTQFPTVKSVEIDGKTYTRADFEDFTPSVLVESPLPFETVRSPLRVTGTANTFEATFSYELTDTDGLIVDENSVTATSGTGTRGTFDFTTKPYIVPFDGVGALIVFERSAKDGSRIHVVEIPLRMTH